MAAPAASSSELPAALSGRDGQPVGGMFTAGAPPGYADENFGQNEGSTMFMTQTLASAHAAFRNMELLFFTENQQGVGWPWLHRVVADAEERARVEAALRKYIADARGFVIRTASHLVGEQVASTPAQDCYLGVLEYLQTDHNREFMKSTYADAVLTTLVDLMYKFLPPYSADRLEGGAPAPPELQTIPPPPTDTASWRAALAVIRVDYRPDDEGGRQFKAHYEGFVEALHRIAAGWLAELERLQAKLATSELVADRKKVCEDRQGVPSLRDREAKLRGVLAALRSGDRDTVAQKLNALQRERIVELWYAKHDEAYTRPYPYDYTSTLDGLAIDNTGGGDCFYASLAAGIGLDGQTPYSEWGGQPHGARLDVFANLHQRVRDVIAAYMNPSNRDIADSPWWDVRWRVLNKVMRLKLSEYPVIDQEDDREILPDGQWVDRYDYLASKVNPLDRGLELYNDKRWSWGRLRSKRNPTQRVRAKEVLNEDGTSEVEYTGDDATIAREEWGAPFPQGHRRAGRRRSQEVWTGSPTDPYAGDYWDWVLLPLHEGPEEGESNDAFAARGGEDGKEMRGAPLADDDPDRLVFAPGALPYEPWDDYMARVWQAHRKYVEATRFGMANRFVIDRGYWQDQGDGTRKWVRVAVRWAGDIELYGAAYAFQRRLHIYQIDPSGQIVHVQSYGCSDWPPLCLMWTYGSELSTGHRAAALAAARAEWEEAEVEARREGRPPPPEPPPPSPWGQFHYVVLLSTLADGSRATPRLGNVHFPEEQTRATYARLARSGGAEARLPVNSTRSDPFGLLDWGPGKKWEEPVTLLDGHDTVLEPDFAPLVQ